MQIKTIKVGSLQTNCYIIIDEQAKQALVIDPGEEASLILPALEGLKVCAIVITHGHPDHFGAMDEIKKATGAKILMGPDDQWFFKPDREIKEGDEIKCGDLSFKVLQTPGHTRGGVCLYAPGHLFSGDTLFSTAHGRVDLPGGSMKEMQQSLKKLAKLPDDTMVYPGHDETTTIGLEKERGTLV